MRNIIINKGWISAIVLFVVCSFILSGSTQRFKQTSDSMNLTPFESDIFSFDNGDNSRLEYVPGEIIIKFRADCIVNISKDKPECIKTCLESIDMLNSKYQVQSIEKAFSDNASPFLSRIYKFTFPLETDILSCIIEYANDSNIDFVETNKIFHACLYPNDPNFSNQWGLHQYNDHDIDAPEAWDIEQGDSDMVIAVIDTGIDYTHPDISGNIWLNSDEIPGNGIDDDENGYIDDTRGWDFVNNDPDPLDDHGHGTCCSGIASAVTNNGIGIAGVGWSCHIMSVKVIDESGSGTYLNVAKGIQYAYENGAHIISMSFCGSEPSNTLEVALDNAYNEGMTLVAAEDWIPGINGVGIPIPGYPACYDTVIGVAATNNLDEKAYESFFGSWVDVAAPGVHILTTLPTYYVTMNSNGYDQNYDYVSGTSAACAYVAGLAALIISHNPIITHEELLTILHSTTDSVNSDFYIGTGRINAYGALSLNIHLVAQLNSILDERMVGLCELDITGTAEGSDFLEYRLYCGQGIYPSAWQLIQISDTPVHNDLLGIWDTHGVMDPGYFTIKLEVISSTDGHVQDFALVYVDPLLMENWPIYLDTINLLASPIAFDFHNDGTSELVVATYGDSADNKYFIGKVYIINSTGDIAPNWPFETEGCISATPAIGDLNEDGVMEIVVASWTWEGVKHLYVLHEDGSLLWEKDGFYSYPSPVLADLDSDGYLEIIIGGKGGRVYAWNYDESSVTGWPITLYDNPGYITSSPLVVDVDRDGDLEVVVNTANHHTYCINNDTSIAWSRLFDSDSYADIYRDPVIADFDGDGDLEIVRDGFGKLWLLEAESGETCSPNWPRIIGQFGNSNFALGDIDSDGLPEIVMGRQLDEPGGNKYFYLYAFNGDGSQVQNWPIETDSCIITPCVIADVDGDASPEIIGRNRGEIRIFSATGEEVIDGWPRYVFDAREVSPPNGPLVADMDGDGEIEIVTTSWYNNVYAWSPGGIFNPTTVEWPMFQRDPQHTGYYIPTSNIPPNKPNKPMKTTIDPIVKNYRFRTSTTDENDDEIYYVWEWGDGTYSGWLGPYDSGAECVTAHKFSSGTYSVRVRAKDVHGTMSEWSDPLSISVSVDQFFGYPTAGSLSSNIYNQIAGSNFEILADGTANYICVYVQTNPGMSPTTKCMIYRSEDSMLVGTTEEKILNNGDDGAWVMYNFSNPKPSLNTNTEYTLVCWSNESCNLLYDYAPSNLSGRCKNQIFGNPPETIIWDSNELRFYSIYCDYSTLPEIKNVSSYPNPTGFGYNTMITVDVECYGVPIDIINVSIVYPDSTLMNFSMTQIDNDTFQYIFNDNWIAGQYNYSIWVSDIFGSSNSSTCHNFNVSAEATINIATLKDSYSHDEFIEITDPPISPEDYYLVDRGLTWNKFYNATSGNNVLEVYTEPVNYQEDNGTWTPINCSLEQLTTNHPAYNYGYRVGNEQGLYNVYFKPNIQNNWPVAFAYNKSNDPTIHVVRSKLVGVGYLDPQSNWAYKYLQNVQSSQGQFTDNKIIYENVFSGTDVVWSYDNTKLKEEIILSNTTKSLLQNHPPSLYGLQNESSYLVFITKLDYQNLVLFNESGNLSGNITVSDGCVAFKDILGYFKCALPIGDAYELFNESVRNKLVYRVLQYNGNYYLLSGLKVQDLNNMMFPVVIDPTITITSSESDGYIYESGSNYETAWSAEEGVVSCEDSYISIGQSKVASFPPDYRIRRGFFIFDTSELPSNAYIDNVTLSLYKKDDYSTTDFTITVQNGQPDYPNDPLDERDYNKEYYSGNGGELNAVNFVNGCNNITITELSWIYAGGITKLCLRSSRDINGTTPTGSEYVNVHSANIEEVQNPDPRPRLIISYRNQSKIKNTGSTNVTGYLLMQVQYLDGEEWKVDHNTVDETLPRTILVGNQLALDTIFNGLVNTNDLTFGDGLYRVYVAFRDPSGDVLVCDDDSLLEACYEFTVDI